MVTVALSEFGSDARPLLFDKLSEASGLSVFSGTVEHGYAMRSVGSHPRCPRCNADKVRSEHQRKTGFI